MSLSITNIVPNVGPTAGHTLVEVLGRGFGARGPQLDTDRRAVHVLLRDRRATDVRVLADDRLACLTPAGAPGPADVVIARAGGDAGNDEVAIAVDGFTYVRQALAVEADLTRLVRTLLQDLKRQVIENVVLTVHTDFDAETGLEVHLASVARLPALVLMGPELAENRFYSMNELGERVTGPGQFEQRRAPYTVDLGFTVIGVSDHTTELLNLLAATQLFFHRNPYLALDRDPANPGAGRVRYELDVPRDGDLKVTSQPNTSNVRSFSGRVVVRGFDLEDLAGVPDESVLARGAVASEVTVEPPAPLDRAVSTSGRAPRGGRDVRDP